MNAHGQRKVLLLTADDMSRHRIARALLASSARVVTARDGDEGLATLIDELLDLDALIMDVDLPGRDGWSLLRLVRAAGGERELRIVMIGRGLDAGRAAQLRALGADEVVDLARRPEAIAAAAGGACGACAAAPGA